MSRVDSEEEDPMTMKRYFGVCVEVGYKYNHPESYKGFSKDAGPPAGGPNNTDQTIFGTGVGIHCFEPSPDGLTKRGKNVLKEVGHVLKKSLGSDFGLKNKKNRVKFWTNPHKKKALDEYMGQLKAVSD